ncbi:hypothetical protein AAEO50_12285 [Rossellomorea oryzaecorticis]|uniref:Uncharacterized protein n=1 Tax=Rossellomorea oryzaecorticis TaxID=1396505 RepID=A0ABU9KCD1_9BACI
MNDMPLVELEGYVTKIIGKNKRVLTFKFLDDNFGEIICTARRKESIMYYNIVRGKKFKLKASLNGNDSENPGYTRNYLYIKHSKEID